MKDKLLDLRYILLTILAVILLALIIYFIIDRQQAHKIASNETIQTLEAEQNALKDKVDSLEDAPADTDSQPTADSSNSNTDDDIDLSAIAKQTTTRPASSSANQQSATGGIDGLDLSQFTNTPAVQQTATTQQPVDTPAVASSNTQTEDDIALTTTSPALSSVSQQATQTATDTLTIAEYRQRVSRLQQLDTSSFASATLILDIANDSRTPEEIQQAKQNIADRLDIVIDTIELKNLLFNRVLQSNLLINHRPEIIDDLSLRTNMQFNALEKLDQAYLAICQYFINKCVKAEQFADETQQYQTRFLNLASSYDNSAKTEQDARHFINQVINLFAD